MKDRRDRIGLVLFNLIVMLALFMPGGISASSTQPTYQEINSTQKVSQAQDDSAADMRINEVMFYPEEGERGSQTDR